MTAVLALATGASSWLSTSHKGALQVGASRVEEVELASGGARPGDAAPTRVVSASLLGDELLERVLPWGKWAAVSYVVDWRQSTPAFGRFPDEIRRTSGNTEDILSLAPDLVVVSSYNNALTALQMQELGIRVHALGPSSTFEELFRQWQLLGARVGHRQEVEAKIGEARRALRAIDATAPAPGSRPTVVLLQGSLSYGGASLQGDCLRHAGLENAVEEWGATPQLNTEHLLHLDPDIIYVADDVQTPGRMPNDELPVGYPWKALRAYWARAIIAIPGSWMASISHHALVACRAYARWAHSSPEPGEGKK